VRLARAFGRFWWDFVVGDEWRLAVIVGVAAALGILAASERWLGGRALAVALAAIVMPVVGGLLIATGRRAAPRSTDRTLGSHPEPADRNVGV
jgi:hypothetical protein